MRRRPQRCCVWINSGERQDLSFEPSVKVGRGLGVSSANLLRILNLAHRDNPRTLRSVLEMPRFESEPVVPIELCRLRRALAA